MDKWHKESAEEVLLRFSLDIENGRTVKSTETRASSNEIFKYPKASIGKVFTELNTDPSFVLLSITFILSAILGNLIESLIGLSVLFAFYFACALVKYRSRKRIENSYKMLLPSAKILECGSQKKLSILDVAVGDLIVFETGDIIPADARIVSCSSLKTAERYVDPRTGKVTYKPYEKNSKAAFDDTNENGSFSNMVYAGSVVISGKGKAVVISIADDTKISRDHGGIILAKTDDLPMYLQSFVSSAKKLSLSILIGAIPVIIGSLITSTFQNPPNGGFDLLYLFLICLCVAVSSMSELSICLAEALVTKQFLPTANKNYRNDSSPLTKLSSADSFSEVDTLLILCPEVLYDKRRQLRQIYFSDYTYRFDSLSSQELDYFYALASDFLANTSSKRLSTDLRAIKSYFSSKVQAHKQEGIKLSFDYPQKNDISITYRKNDSVSTLTFLSATSNSFEAITHYRSYDGEIKPINEERRKQIYLAHNSFSKQGLAVFSFVSIDSAVGAVFEGMVGCGCEFPYADGEIRDKMNECGIDAILVLPEENEANINFAKSCGIVSSDSEIALASDYSNFRRDITDAPLSTKAYIGFGLSETEYLATRLSDSGRKVLPIIKNSSHRKLCSRFSIYATDSEYSYDSVRLSSSLCLNGADANSRDGGLFDCIISILGCTMAKLKLGIFKNSLIFSIFLRIVAVFLPLLFGSYDIIPSAPIILLIGLLFDAVSMSIYSHHKSVPVKASDTSRDASKLFSTPMSVIYGIGGALCGALVALLTHLLADASTLSIRFAPVFFSYSLVFTHVSLFGAFIIILKKRARGKSFYLRYVTLALLSLAVPILSHYLGSFIEALSFLCVQPSTLLFAIIPSAIAFALIILIDRIIDGLRKFRVD